MFRFGRFIVFVAALIAAGWQPHLALAAGVDDSQEIKRLMAAAVEKGERELTLTWDGAALGGSEGAKLFEALFNRMYGHTVKAKVNFTPGPTMPQMAAKIAQEVAAGQKSTSDILLGTVEHFTPMVSRTVLEEYDYSRHSPRINKKMVAPRNIAVEIYTSTGGIVYNTNLVSANEVPRKLDDVLNPKWKGKLASTPYAAYFNRVYLRPEWGMEKMKAFVTKLSDHAGGLIRVNEVSRIISGEFVMLVLASSQDVAVERGKGAPVDFAMPDDAAVAHFAYMGIPRTAAHPNLSKLYINMILSEEGQRLLYKVFASDHHELPGSQAAARLNALKARGVDMMRVDVKTSLEHPEMQSLQAELVKILNKQPTR